MSDPVRTPPVEFDADQAAALVARANRRELLTPVEILLRMGDVLCDQIDTPPVEFDAMPPAAPVRITPDDIRRALDAWRRDAPPELSGLLEARPMGQSGARINL